MEARKKVTRLFPVESAFGAICAEFDEAGKIIFSAKNTIKYVAKNPKLSNEDPGVLLEAKGTRTTVLSNGYCFYQPLEGDHIMLANLLIRGKKSNISAIDVDPIIDPGMIAMLDQSEEDLTVCGVSNNGRRILAYTIAEPKNEDKGIRRFATAEQHTGRIGVVVYELEQADQRTITNIASCPHHNKDSEPKSRHVVIGYNTGEIEIFIARGDNKLVREMKLKSRNEDFVDMDLLLTEGGQLVACSRKAKKIEVWNLAKADVSQTHAIAEVGDLSVSLDGAYIVARDNSKEHEQAVQVYELPKHDSIKLQHSRLLTKNHIECVVVGPEGSLITAHNNAEGKATLQNEGGLLSLLQGKIEAVNLQPTPERVSNAHRPKSGLNTKDLFGKLKLMKKKPASHKPHVTELDKTEDAKVHADQPAVKPAEVPEASVVSTSEKAAEGGNNNNAVPAQPAAPVVVAVVDAPKPEQTANANAADAAVVADEKAAEKLEALKEHPAEDESKKAKLVSVGTSSRKYPWSNWGKPKAVATPATAAEVAPAPVVAKDNNVQAKDGEMRELRLK